MEEERSFSTRTLNVVGFGLLALAITILAGGIWSALLVTNLRSSPAVPWSVPAMALLLWLAWSYLGGSGWPRSTSEARRRYLRAYSKSRQTYLVGIGRGCSIGGSAGWNLDRAVPIGEDATQRSLGCVELSANHGSTHDLDGVVGFSSHGGSWLSRIFSGRPRTRGSRPTRCRDLIGCVRSCPWTDTRLPVAQAPLLLSRGYSIRRHGLPHQFDPASNPCSLRGSVSLLHSHLAA